VRSGVFDEERLWWAACAGRSPLELVAPYALDVEAFALGAPTSTTQPVVFRGGTFAGSDHRLWLARKLLGHAAPAARLRAEPLTPEGLHVESFALTPDLGTAVLLAGGTLQRIAIDPEATPELLTAPFLVGTTLWTPSPDARPPLVTPDGSRVLFVARDALQQPALFVQPLTGGAPQRLDAPPVGSHVDPATFQLTPDGTRVVYQPETPGRRGLHSVPVDGSQPPVDLAALPSGGHVVSFRLLPDGRHVLLHANRNGARLELWLARIDGRTPVRPISIPLGHANAEVRSDFRIDADGEWVVYAADAETDERFELWRSRLGAPRFAAR
jgi:hypothetical protein